MTSYKLLQIKYTWDPLMQWVSCTDPGELDAMEKWITKAEKERVHKLELKIRGAGLWWIIKWVCKNEWEPFHHYSNKYLFRKRYIPGG